MGLLNGSLQIGRSAIIAAQAGISVTGNNIANAATPGYSRQRVDLAPTQYTEIVPGRYTGTGVRVAEVQRLVDDALNTRIRAAVGDSASYLIQQQALARVEASFNELTEEDLSSRLNSFFNAFSSLAAQPQDMATRNVVIQEGASLTNFVRELGSELRSIQGDLDVQVRYQVDQADALADQIAQMNSQVAVAEAGQAGSAAALRDQRDELLKELSQLINITTREVEGGTVNVFIGSEPLIQYSTNRGLSYRESVDDSGEVLAEVVFADNEEAVSLTSGKIHGLITARDDQVGDVLNELDEWTATLIYEVNRLHSLGSGLTGVTEVLSDRAVTDLDESLASMADTGLPWEVSNGVFYIQVYDQEGQAVGSPEMIKVDIGVSATDTTMNSLVADIDSRANLTATVDSANRLHIECTTQGHTLSFMAPEQAEDATDLLAVIGINTFFEGYDSSTMRVDADLQANAELLAASGNGVAGNGDVADWIAQLAIEGASSLGGTSLSESFITMVGQISTASRASQDNYSASQVVADTLELERQSISGVSIDEEAIQLMMFQRAFQGAARYVSLIDQMLDEMMNLV